MPISIIIDTDPGQDDAVAILLALASPEDLDVRGIVAVAGNVPLERTALNARQVVRLAGRPEVPVFAGCPRPLSRDLVTAEHVHGPTGLGGLELTDDLPPLQAQHGVDFIIDTVMGSEPGTITVCILGPCTNLGLALVKAPQIAGRIREVVMMGGAYFEVGNITPASEFNIHVDPEAADIVLRSGIPVTMIPLDLTHTVLVTKARLDAFRALGNRVGTAIADMLTFSEKFDRSKYGWDGAPLHDPCVPAYLLRPSLFSGRLVNVSVEVMSPLTRGMTVADWWQITDRPRNVNFLKDADAEGFFALLTSRLSRLP